MADIIFDSDIEKLLEQANMLSRHATSLHSREVWDGVLTSYYLQRLTKNINQALIHHLDIATNLQLKGEKGDTLAMHENTALICSKINKLLINSTSELALYIKNEETPEKITEFKKHINLEISKIIAENISEKIKKTLGKLIVKEIDEIIQEAAEFATHNKNNTYNNALQATMHPVFIKNVAKKAATEVLEEIQKKSSALYSAATKLVSLYTQGASDKLKTILNEISKQAASFSKENNKQKAFSDLNSGIK